VTLLLFSVLLASVVGAFVVRPIWARRMAVLTDAAPGAVLDAEAKRRMTLAALKDLEYDYLGGKLDQADYLAQRDRLSYEALEAIRAAEAVQASSADTVSVEGASGDADAGDGSSSEVTTAAAPRIAAPEMAHACGFVNPPLSRFCAGCGKRLR